MMMLLMMMVVLGTGAGAGGGGCGDDVVGNIIISVKKNLQSISLLCGKPRWHGTCIFPLIIRKHI